MPQTSWQNITEIRRVFVTIHFFCLKFHFLNTVHYSEFVDMSGNNNNNRPSSASTAATAAIGAAVGYGAYKLFQSMFGSAEPHKSDTGASGMGGVPDVTADDFFEKNISVVATVPELHDALEELKLYMESMNIFLHGLYFVEERNYIFENYYLGTLLNLKCLVLIANGSQVDMVVGRLQFYNYAHIAVNV